MSGVPTLVVIGGGPRGTGVIERIAANSAELYGDRRLDIHLVDPYPPGGGRIWRQDQSPLLWMNSMAEDVTMFTDDTVKQDGPIRPGPAVHTWAADVREGRTVLDTDPAILAEIRELGAQDFPSRRLQSVYLRWVYEQSLAALPPGITVHEHQAYAHRVSGSHDGRQQVWLQGCAEPLLADLVVLTVGHLDAEPEPEQLKLADFAARHGLVHLPPDFTADSDLSALPAGEPVIVRGFGLAFIDLMALLTEGRGGRYEDGVYLPSGREPVLYVGSRRGVPYHAKIGYTWQGEQPPLPRYLGPDQVDAVLDGTGPVDFRRDLWPTVVKELGHAHYHRLFTAHPERTAVGWGDFEEKYAVAEPGSPELRALVASSVPDPADHLDLDALDRPLDGLRHPRTTPCRTGCAPTSPPTSNAATTPGTAPTSPSSSACCPSTGSWSGPATSATGGTASSATSPPARPAPGSASSSPSPGPESSASSAPGSPWRRTRSKGSSGPAAQPCPTST